MSNKQVLNFVEDWLEKRKLKKFFENKKKQKQTYIKIKEENLYELCYKLVDLIKENTE